MKELIHALIVDSKLRRDFKPEWATNETDRELARIIQELDRNGMPVSHRSLADALNEHEGTQAWVSILNERMEVRIEAEISYIRAWHIGKWNERVNMEISNLVLNNQGIATPTEVRDLVQREMRKFETTTRSESISSAVESAYETIGNMWEGKTQPFWRTGMEKIDSFVQYARQQIVLIVAQAKMGKTRFVVDQVMKLIDRQPDIQVCWFTFEMSKTELIICIIANITGIEVNVINAKRRRPNKEERKQILYAKELIKNMKITYFEQPCDIATLRHDVESRQSDEMLVVLDNLGLVKQEVNMSETQHDNHVAAQLKELRDMTEACLFIVHHMSKSSDDPRNAESLFRPSPKDVRGSARIVDYCNLLLILHRPTQHAANEAKMSPDQWAKLLHKMKVDVARSRSGGVAEINLDHKLECCRFSESAHA